MTVRMVVCAAVLCLLMEPLSAGAWSLGEAGTHDAGWVLDDHGERVFAIGLFGIPGYTFARDDRPEPAANDSVYLAVTEPFNTVIMQAGYQKPYMFGRGTLFMAGSMTYNWSLHNTGYTGDFPLAENPNEELRRDIPFDRMQRIRTNIDSLTPYIGEQVVTFVDTCYRDESFVHFIRDEPDTGGRGWFWPPEVIGAYHEQVHERSPGRLTYIDFGGNIGGNRFFYERTFGRVFRTGTDPARGECNPGRMNTFCYAFDGTPIFEYRSGWFGGGDWVLKPPSDMAYAFYENVYRTARAYRDASDIAGVNSYLPFRDIPEAAGEVVDAIHDACGPEKPVWLFFDGEAYSRGGELSYDQYARLVTCQVYTAIIHGATGALFYAASMTPEAQTAYWPLMQTLACTLKRRLPIITADEAGHAWDRAYHTLSYDHIHYSIRETPSGDRYLIASNTDKTVSHPVSVTGFPRIQLEPLEVLVIAEDGVRY